MSDAATPRLSNRGFATIFVILPPGQFRNEFVHVYERLKSRAKIQPGIVSERPEVLYLLGQARFAARVEADDYRDVLERAYPDRDSHALVSNAVFSIPYFVETPDDVVHRRADPGMVRFLTHLRVRRTVYSQNPVQAERLIVEELQNISKRLEGEVTIEAGLGWADFIVSGVVHPANFARFLTCLVDFNAARIDSQIGDDECVFKRSLTLLGYAWTGTHEIPVLTVPLNALMFIRARPGRLAEVEGEVQRTFPGATVQFVDGKIDVIGTIAGERPDFFSGHEALSEGSGRYLIEKFETHVVFGRELTSLGPEKPVADVVGAPLGDCRCIWVKHPSYELGEPGDETLPPSLTNAIWNLDFLFSSTLHDHANCCDARTAVEACENSLKRLLHNHILDNAVRHDRKERGEILDDVTAKKVDAAHAQEIRRIDRWVRTSERILRQRTVGSFEEFLGQSDRAVSYRGGAQKVLTVADNLMNDLYGRLLSRPPDSYLTSLYDSVDRIEHVVGTGLVRMPVRALFFLPGVVPDLWHEVGSFHYFRMLKADDVDLDLVSVTQRHLYEDLADHFGDLVSFLYGFRLNLDQFGTALIEGWMASQKYKRAADYVRFASYSQIVARIVAVGEFRDQETERLNGGHTTANPISRVESLLRVYDEVVKIADDFWSYDLPYPSAQLRNTVLEILIGPQLSAGLDELRARLRPADIDSALMQPAAAEEDLDFENPAALRSFTPDTDLNDEFRKLYWAVIMKRREVGAPPNAFAQSAALIRGAALEYHRRAVLSFTAVPPET